LSHFVTGIYNTLGIQIIIIQYKSADRICAIFTEISVGRYKFKSHLNICLYDWP